MPSLTAPTESEAAPIEGYDGLSGSQVVARLSQCSQVELASIDAYERSHEDREAVTRKLRYLRTEEPFEGYDELDADRILAGLDGADAHTLHAVRGYEAKLRRRPEVLKGVERLRMDRHSQGSADAAEERAPSYAGTGGVKGALSGVGVSLLVAVAVLLLVVSVFVAGVVVITAFAPNAFN